jgi:Arylsulfotransferase (ASST)
VPSGPIEGTVIEAVIQEIDIASGRLLFEWHSLPSINPSESYLPAPSAGSGYDYLHANSVDLDVDGNLLLSARHTWGLYKIDRGTGALIWRLNGRESDFTLGDGAAVAWQHDARWQPGGVSIFDDGASDQPPNFESQSRGIVLSLDTAAMTARLARAFVHPEGLLATSQGSLQLLSTGGAFIGWGKIPRFSEFDADGELVFDASFVAGQQSYRAYRYPWKGQPADRPAVSAVHTTDGTAVYASWNGATEVAVWDVLAGSQAEALVSLGKVARSGFESAIEIEAAAGFVAVRALNATGQEIGRSETVAIA